LRRRVCPFHDFRLPHDRLQFSDTELAGSLARFLRQSPPCLFFLILVLDIVIVVVVYFRLLGVFQREVFLRVVLFEFGENIGELRVEWIIRYDFVGNLN
jgi:hypothetical protein